MLIRHLPVLATVVIALTACSTIQENPNYQYSTKYKGASPHGPTQVASHVSIQTAQPRQHAQTQKQRIVQARPQSNTAYQTHAVSYQNTPAQTASYTKLDHRCLTRETNRQLIGDAAGYGIGDNSINCDPIQVSIPQHSAVISPAYAPTTQPNSNMVLASSETISAPTDNAMPTEITDSYGTPGYQAMLGEDLNVSSALTQGYGFENAQPLQNAQFTQTVIEPMNTDINSAGIIQYEVNQGDTVYSLSRKLCSSVEIIKDMNELSADFAINIGDTLKLPASGCR